MVARTSIIFGMKRSVTGSNAGIKDVTLLSAQAALSANELSIQTSDPTRQ
jgi:hypothetical protein